VLRQLVRWHLAQPPAPPSHFTRETLRIIASEPDHPLYAAATRTLIRISHEDEARLARNGLQREG
jgi:hypothetical protein